MDNLKINKAYICAEERLTRLALPKEATSVLKTLQSHVMERCTPEIWPPHILRSHLENKDAHLAAEATLDPKWFSSNGTKFRAHF